MLNRGDLRSGGGEARGGCREQVVQVRLCGSRKAANAVNRNTSALSPDRISGNVGKSG